MRWVDRVAACYSARIRVSTSAAESVVKRGKERLALQSFSPFIDEPAGYNLATL